MVPRALVAVAVALALADASIVALALPPLLADLHTSVERVAAVIGVYTLVLAICLAFATAIERRVEQRLLGAGGLAVFALAGVLCAAADDIQDLLLARALQAVGAAAALVAGFALLTRSGLVAGRRLWTAAALFGTAAGPALGGALTEAFDWRAIFLVQAPIAAAAAIACLTGWRDPVTASPIDAPLWAGRSAARDRAASGAAGHLRAAFALGVLAAALTGVLFLVVLLLVSGWSLSPLAAAGAVSILPVAAVAGARIGGDAWLRASTGCALVAAGVLALAWLPAASVGWTIAAQLLAGIGMGMALPALAGELLEERTPRQAASLLALRHAGITLALAILAPVTAAQLDRAVADTRERGVALMLDARLPPLAKLELAGPLVEDLDPVDPRAALERSLAGGAGRFADDPEDRRAYAELRERADDTLVAGIDSAFRPAFLITGGLALLGAIAAAPAAARSRGIALAAALGALTLPAVYLAAEREWAPEPVVIADPCRARDGPAAGGLDGLVQDAALVALDRAACRFGSSREALALALVDAEAARDYEARYGVDPRSAGDLLRGMLGVG